MNALEKPRHGEKRNWRIEREADRTQVFTDANGNDIALTYSPDEQSVVERYCESCSSWTEQHGISDAILGECKSCGTLYSKAPSKP
ncbi:MAG: hypothetical protein AWU57_939 [Marinobacter sp. T13-3]|nr:MAG: hypothetical protein AWU57_939 [Marinobacter sp. T13-3]